MKQIVLAGLVSLGLVSSAQAGVVNGDFETGDLTGWTASAIDGLGTPIPVAPHISVNTVGTNSLASFVSREFDDGLFIATLEQTFLVETGSPFLVFDFSLPTTPPDPTGTGTSPFLDALFVSVDNGISIFDLLLVDHTGVLANPFGTAPGAVSLSASSDPAFDFTVAADLSSLAGTSVTLLFDLIQEDDGFQFSMNLDNVEASNRAGHAAVPEPSSFALLGIGGIALIGFARCKRKQVTLSQSAILSPQYST